MNDRQAILKACEESPSEHQLLVAADWFADNAEPDWERALRWMAKWDKAPHRPAHAENWMWTCYGGLAGERFGCGVRHTLPRTLCKRIGFWEWRCYDSWEAAVGVLVTALAQGDVECKGDPTQVDEESIRLMDQHTQAVRAELERMEVEG